ncbi:hypothetical protein EDB92DRAFT_1811986 [Lactarius akahatsu]|uniref:Uncharacterized protein n=1 Tax=Lactarius akahatsu TaxID=416441 RepID=A0AAD4LSJ7_9AGAM|nr:hypothetical protein EDB92DRAFT_1811986 [Lactarius akahatsu]
MTEGAGNTRKPHTTTTDEMDAALKELDKLQYLTSDSPSTNKSKTPAIQDSLNSLLQTLHAQKKRLEAGIASEAELETLAKTVESRKKEIDDRQKEIYNSLARYGKALDKVCLAFWCYDVRADGESMTQRFTTPLPTYEPLFASDDGQKALEHVIATHLLRTGRFSTAETFIQEFMVDLPAGRQTQFVDLYRILVALRNKDIKPALEWVEHNRDFLRSRSSSLEFYLHRSEYLRLLLKSNPSEQSKAIQYATKYLRPFFLTHTNEFKRLMACLIFLPKERMQKSPYEDLTSDTLHLDLENMFATEFSASLGMSKQPPLRVVGDIGGGGALAKIEKGRKIMRERKSEWSQSDELPIEIPLPPENRYHSVFACPVSKDQSTEQNPPMMMSCGHVVSKDSLQKLSKINGYTTTLGQRSAISDVSRSSALSAPELAKLTPDEVEFLDAVISRAPPSATTFIHIFKAYNDVISERGLDAENEVDYYKKLLKIGTLKGENWASKWRTVRAQNGYTEASIPSRSKPPLRKPIATPTPPSRVQTQTHLPLSKVAPDTPRPQSSTARLLQRLKTLQREEPIEPSDSAPDDLLSQTDITDAGTDSLLHAEPPPACGRSSSELTADNNNTLGLDIGATSTYPPSSTLVPSKATGWRWSERDLEIEKSVPFLTSTPPLPTHKLASRPTPASIVQKISNSLPINSTPRRPPADLRTPKQPVAYEDEVWNKIRVAQDEKTADRFRNAQLLQRCLDVWKQGHDWITTTTVQIAHARDTFVLRVAIHKWRAALQHQRERAAHADALANAYRQKATLERQKAAWRADMRTRMQTVRSLRDAALRRDAWAHWRRLYQSRLLQQRVEGKLRETEVLKGRADEFAATKEGKVVDRCWDSWRRAAELKSAERVIAERVGARIVRDSMVSWRQRTERTHSTTLPVKRFAFNRWRNSYGRILALERRADKQIARQEGALSASNIPECFGKLGKLGRGVCGVRRDLEATALAFAQRSQVHVASSTLRVWQKRFATKQGALAFAVQYANAQLQYRVLFNWRVQLRAHVKHFRQAKILEKFFVVRRAWKMWMERAVERGREKRLKEWDNGRAGKHFAGWREKALRQRRHRLSEQQVQSRANTRVLKDVLSHWTNRVIAVKLRELEVVQRRDKAIVLSAFCKWKKVCIRHVEELGLMESYQDVKREENMRRMFYKWLTAARKVRNRRAVLQERESEMQKIQLEAVWDKWRGRFQAEKLLPLSLPAVRFHASCVRAKFWKVWRDAMPRALQAKLARETDKKAVLSRALEKWLQMYRTKVALRAVARARQMRLPTSYKPALTHRSNPMPPRPRNPLPATPVRPPSPDAVAAASADETDAIQERPTQARARAAPITSHHLPSSPSRRTPLRPAVAAAAAAADASSARRPKLSYYIPPAPRSTDTTPAGLREPSPTRSAASQPPSTVAASEARASLWAELKVLRRRSRTPAPPP